MGEESPKNKVKFLCSHGGKVLPRPSDGVLKYVGGETRVICVPRDVTFYEVMKKVSGMVEGEVVLKYQLVPEDLDTLVSVRNDEDLKHMIEEYDRHESAGASLLRAFLFPFTKPPPPPSPSGAYLLEQRYIDAINGIIRTGTSTSPRAKQPCSACSSPKSISPDGHTATESPFPPARLSNSLHKVRSSPSLTNLNNSSNNIQQHDHSHHHHHLHPFAYPSPPRQDAQLGMGRSPPVMTDMGRGGGGGGGGFNYYYPAISRPHKPYAYQDDNIYGPVTFERVHSVPRSPRKSIWE